MYHSLNGDIVLWNPVFGRVFEISLMGIRIDKTALICQLETAECHQRKELLFHQTLLNDNISLSIGGGIGPSRLCMYFLRCAHIGEVQVFIWLPEMITKAAAAGIVLRG